MMASPSELTLDCKPHTYSMLLKSFGDHHLHPHHQNDQTLQKLEDFLSRLEEERLKIDAFKRELPLCMQLLTNAMEASKQQLQSFRANNNNHGAARPVLEEFIPLKNSSSLEGTTDQKAAANATGDKANWMTTAQLWSQGNNNNNNNESSMQQKIPSKETEIGFSVSPNPQMNNNGGAFLPFSKDHRSGSCPSPTLALASPDGKELEEKKSLEINVNLGKCSNNGPATTELGKSGDCGGGGGGGATLPPPQDSQTAAATATQPHRKARRCWSPDLHRRFVNALQMLGGSQVATPKQIRELMKVDGLTNDEVKSHLQKYRLHTRRPGPTPQAAAAAAPQLVVLGGIWVPPEYATAAAAAHGGAAAAAAATLYGAHPTTTHAHHPAPQHFSVGHEFYAAPTPPPPQHLPLHHHAGHPLHHQFHMYKPPPHAQTSPESDGRGTGDRSESIEDGKSESGSWRADSGGEGRALAALREDGEVSNGSDITLKF
ncbi:PREDICTED: myb family transcription factor EFM-like [Ipomoea nil]|uniref:myb family transcription factor EFM-like n=1 Tax=Ipomoea nil TaxID=35883 RepID=UPI0009016C89|nr:PREDICTED: myb family transcription factor EFM-like [Ipomoea nil]